ncbi:MAG: CopD family protein [Burkholderiales bacterium]|nr:CopD family protein [Burkholderiales bacterium]
MQIARWLHLTGIVVWVGGMFFAHFALRPAAAELAPPVRLPLLLRTLSGFFGWAGAAIVVVLGSGAALYAVPGSPGAPGWAVQAMTTIGLVMTLVYAYIVLVPYRRMREAVVASDWPAGGAAMGLIRRLVGLNLALGLFTVAIATLGRAL